MQLLCRGRKALMACTCFKGTQGIEMCQQSHGDKVFLSVADSLTDLFARWTLTILMPFPCDAVLQIQGSHSIAVQAMHSEAVN